MAISLGMKTCVWMVELVFSVPQKRAMDVLVKYSSNNLVFCVFLVKVYASLVVVVTNFLLSFGKS
jgi:hypothetical protein